MDNKKVEAVLKSLNWVKFNVEGAPPHSFEYAVGVYTKSAIQLITELAAEIEDKKGQKTK